MVLQNWSNCKDQCKVPVFTRTMRAHPSTPAIFIHTRTAQEYKSVCGMINHFHFSQVTDKNYSTDERVWIHNTITLCTVGSRFFFLRVVESPVSVSVVHEHDWQPVCPHMDKMTNTIQIYCNNKKIKILNCEWKMNNIELHNWFNRKPLAKKLFTILQMACMMISSESV